MPTISMQRMGQRGRFANQLFQYAFLKVMSWDKGYAVATPSWIGQQLFEGIDDPIASGTPPRLIEKENFFVKKSTIIDRLNGKTDVDVEGNFLYHTSFYARHKQALLDTFVFRKDLDEAYTKILDSFRASHTMPLVGLHYRLTDYRNAGRLIAPKEWYGSVLEQIGPHTLFVCSDEIELAQKTFGGLTSDQIGIACNTFNATFFQDFWLLAHCDHVLCSDSTFSFFACMLNKQLQKAYRPALHEGKLIEFDPWNSHVSDLRTRDRLKDT